MPRRLVLSILHHSIPPLRKGVLAEEDGIGWHFRTAKALMKYGGVYAIAMRPSGFKEMMIKNVNGVPLILTPTMNLSPIKKLWKWSEYSSQLAELTKYFVKKYDGIPYIHEYRALNSELIIKKLLDYSMILQHHGSYPPKVPRILRGDIKELSKYRRELMLKKVHGAIFVVNRVEKRYLEETLGVDAYVVIRTMAVDFNELKLLSSEEKSMLRKAYGIPENATVLITYAGVFREEFSTMKGGHLIPRLWKELRKGCANKVVVIVTGLSERLAERYRRMGILAYKFLPHKEFLNLLKLSDIFFMLATREYYGAGGAVTVMEALALGKPVVSPALIHFPKSDEVKHVGIVVPFISNEEAFSVFTRYLTWCIENLDMFKPEIIRNVARKYYSWRSFVKDFEDTLRKI